MNLLILASAHPSFHKGTAANVVLASLIQSLVTLGYKAIWATVGPGACEPTGDPQANALVPPGDDCDMPLQIEHRMAT